MQTNFDGSVVVASAGCNWHFDFILCFAELFGESEPETDIWTQNEGVVRTQDHLTAAEVDWASDWQWLRSTGVNAHGDAFVGRGELIGTGSHRAWIAYLVDPILEPEEALEELVEQVAILNLQQGISNSLDAKIDNALDALESTRQNSHLPAINSMEAFINSVEAQSGHQITPEDAAALIAGAEAIIDLIQQQ